MATIDPSRRDLIEEFRRNPVGRHSPDLRVMLNTLRKGQTGESWVLVCIEPHRRWRLARKEAGRSGAVRLVGDAVYTSPEQAEWEVFRLMWRERTGEDLP